MKEKAEGDAPVRRKGSGNHTLEAGSSSSSSSAAASCGPAASVDDGFKHRFRSYRLRGAYEKPWLADPAVRKTRWNNAIVCAWMLLGLVGAAVICFFSVWPYRNLDVRPPLGPRTPFSADAH